MLSDALRAQIGEIDIYLFDQLLRGRFDHCDSVLDAGCGEGRNLMYLLGQGLTCFGIDQDPRSIQAVRVLAARLAPALPIENFRVGAIEHLPWENGTMDVVLASAVLHFARDRDQCLAQVTELWRVLAPGGLFFARLASTIGLEPLRGAAAGQRVKLPDGSERFVVDEVLLIEWTAHLGGELADPIKTTNVQQERCMTTWCVRKPGVSGEGPVWR
jgi:SAM-dependent methyltransferase